MLRQNPAPARVQADFDTLPFSENAFDAVAYTASLFLVPEPAVAVAEAKRVLRDGGLVGAVAPLGWYTRDGHDIFETLARDSRSPTPTSAVLEAVEESFDVTVGTWTFSTTARDVRQFHEIPAMAARLYPRDDPSQRIEKVKTLMQPLEGTFEQRWQWVVGRTE
jgi:cyclopropane-fatty-acyl-phospholipid synthase